MCINNRLGGDRRPRLVGDAVVTATVTALAGVIETPDELQTGSRRFPADHFPLFTAGLSSEWKRSVIGNCEIDFSSE